MFFSTSTVIRTDNGNPSTYGMAETTFCFRNTFTLKISTTTIIKSEGRSTKCFSKFQVTTAFSIQKLNKIPFKVSVSFFSHLPMNTMSHTSVTFIIKFFSIAFLIKTTTELRVNVLIFLTTALNVYDTNAILSK